MTALQTSMFDYAALDTETRIVVQQRTTEIRERTQTAARAIIEIGERLIEVRDRLPYGQFGAWLKAEFDWSDGHARKMMQVARSFATNDQRDAFAPTALYLLAAPAVGDEARDEATDRAAAGEVITPAVAKEIITRHTPAPVAPDPLLYAPTIPELPHDLRGAWRLFVDADTDSIVITHVASGYALKLPRRQQPTIATWTHCRDLDAALTQLVLTNWACLFDVGSAQWIANKTGYSPIIDSDILTVAARCRAAIPAAPPALVVPTPPADDDEELTPYEASILATLPPAPVAPVLPVGNPPPPTMPPALTLGMSRDEAVSAAQRSALRLLLREALRLIGEPQDGEGAILPSILEASARQLLDSPAVKAAAAMLALSLRSL